MSRKHPDTDAHARLRLRRSLDRIRSQRQKVYAAHARGEVVPTGYLSGYGPDSHAIPASTAAIIAAEQAKAAPQVLPVKAAKRGGGMAGIFGRALRSLAFTRRAGRES